MVAQPQRVLDSKKGECVNSYFATTSSKLPQATSSCFVAIQNFRSHLSVINIEQMHGEDAVSHFRLFEPADVWNEVNRSDKSKRINLRLPFHSYFKSFIKDENI